MLINILFLSKSIVVVLRFMAQSPNYGYVERSQFI